jgi:hypothetical protein
MAFFKVIVEAFANHHSDGSIFIQPNKVNTLIPLFEIEKIPSVQTLSLVEKITTCLDSFKRSLNSIINSSSKLSPPWVSVPQNGIPPKSIPHIVATCPLPSNQVLNKFKSAFFVIHKTVPDSHPFSQMSASDITNKFNRVLKDMEAKTDDGSFISIKGTARPPSGDFEL